MDKILLKIQYSDPEYNKALEKALLLRSASFVLSKNHADLVIDEKLFPPFQPVQSIVAKIMAILNRPIGPAKPLENVKFTAFTAAIGGGGLTSTALCYARLASRIQGLKVAFLSFDPDFRNDFPKEDEYGVIYLDSIPNVLDVDELILDVPYGVDGYQDYLDMCEKRVVVLGFDENREVAGHKLYEELQNVSLNYVDPPKTYEFQNKRVQSIEINDIHSAFGKEVRKLAGRLEEE